MTELNPTPEQYLTGLQQGPNHDDLRFVMPKLGTKGLTSTMSFGLESLDRILGAHNKLPNIKTDAVKFVGFVASKHVAGLAANILISELFDTAMIDMLDTIGDTAMKAAIQALSDAKSEPTIDGKRWHRKEAGVLLRLAHQSFEDSLADRRQKEQSWRRFILPYDQPSGLRESAEHCGKAALAATTRSLIDKDGGLHSAVTWANNARTHFTSYHDKIQAAATKDIYQVVHGEHRRTHNEYGCVKVDDLDDLYSQKLVELPRQQQQFNALHSYLISPDGAAVC